MSASQAARQPASQQASQPASQPACQSASQSANQPAFVYSAAKLAPRLHGWNAAVRRSKLLELQRLAAQRSAESVRDMHRLTARSLYASEHSGLPLQVYVKRSESPLEVYVNRSGFPLEVYVERSGLPLKVDTHVYCSEPSLEVDVNSGFPLEACVEHSGFPLHVDSTLQPRVRLILEAVVMFVSVAICFRLLASVRSSRL